MNYGYTGNVLRVDLSRKIYWIENPPDSFYRIYWGGRSIALYYMLKEMKAGIDPFSGDNLLIFATSVIVGTTAPAINRYTVCAKSPLTGAQGESEAGGYFASELKKAGFDAIIIRGISSHPIYIFINDREVQIKNADHLWGKDTGETQRLIKEELHDHLVKIAQIGPAGENLVRFANIVNEMHHFNGRNGLGAVMGSKKLKAIVVRGTHYINIFSKDKIKQIFRQFNSRVMKNPLSRDLRERGTIAGIKINYEDGWLPTRNWTSNNFKNGENLTAEVLNRTILQGKGTCYACPIICKRIVKSITPYFTINPIFGGPEYESVAALGSLCGIDDLEYVAKANEICNRNTVDTISMGMTISFAMQCYEEGILTKEDTNGIDLKFGNKKSMLQMIEKIISRESGLGNILAEGTLRAAKKIGNGAEKFIHQVKGQEIPMHDPRVKTGMGLQFAVADYGADHMKAAHDIFFRNNDSWGINEMSGLGIIEAVSPFDIGRKKVRLFKILDIYWSILDILGVCIFAYVPRGIGTLEELLEIIRSITGWRTSWFELMKVGERSINMARIFNLREGFTPKDDTLPEIFFQNFNGGPRDKTGAINKMDFIEAVKLRYEIMGWDRNTSIPSKGKLLELRLDWLIGELKN